MLLGLDAGRLDHLRPLLGGLAENLGELGRCASHHRAAHFDDAAVVEEDDEVGVAHGGQTVGDDEGRAVLAQPVDGLFDPGFGFAKTLAHNLSLFKHMEALYRLGRPLLVGVSRKSMIGLTLDRPVGERLYGSLALAALAMTKGASILRVHDVAETVDVVRMIAAVESAK